MPWVRRVHLYHLTLKFREMEVEDGLSKKKLFRRLKDMGLTTGCLWN